MSQKCVYVICECVCLCVKQRHVSPVKAVVLSGTEGGSEAWKHSWHPADLYWTSSRSDTTSTRTEKSWSGRAGPLNRWHATTWTWRPSRQSCHENLSGNSISLPCRAVSGVWCSREWHFIQRWIASTVLYRKRWIFIYLFKKKSNWVQQNEVEIKAVLQYILKGIFNLSFAQKTVPLWGTNVRSCEISGLRLSTDLKERQHHYASHQSCQEGWCSLDLNSWHYM